jgi:pyruvate/2-oxoglutarate dehydrogenase complex dihydrolipoamide acyltransferase (E2) component
MPCHQLILPDLGMADQPIVLSLWLVSPGSLVTRGQPIAEVLVGAATVDLPSPADGVLLEALVDEDEPIAVGQALAIIENLS